MIPSILSARDEGIEPPPKVLETSILPLYESRPRLAAARLTDYFISLCIVCFLHFLQNFFISNFSLSFFLFRVVK